jgi:uncharacterized protein YaaW (UPF0174 family)
MIITHSLEFETVVDENSEAFEVIQNMPEEYVKAMLEQMLKDLVAPELEPVLAKLNENGSWAILRLAE